MLSCYTVLVHEFAWWVHVGMVAGDKLNVIAKFSNDLRKVYIPWDSEVPSESLICWDIQEYLWLLLQWLEKKSL